MSSLTLSLPDSMREFVEQQVAKGGLGSADEYLLGLIREAQQREAKQRLEAMLLEGLEGEPIEVDDEFWERFRARLVERHGHADAQ